MVEPVDGRATDLAERLRMLADLATGRSLDRLVVQDPATLAWLFECRVHVPQTLESACFAAVVETVGPLRARVVTNAIEAPRLLDTELAGLDLDWEVLQWWEPRARAFPTGAGVGADRPVEGTTDVAAALTALRRVLSPRQQRLLADVAAEAAAATQHVAARLEPSTSEHEAAGRLAGALLERGLDPVVLMVGGGERPVRHRHPLPTSEPLGRRAMLVTCARRHGLVASCTRIVAFTDVDAAERGRYHALLRVEQALLDATRTGARLGDVVAAGIAAYPANGFDPVEWQRHHQGGLSGLQPREFPAHPDSGEVLADGSVVAWNPSAGGWKVEDTCIVGELGARPLVHAAGWPSVSVAGRQRPDVWVR